MPAEAVVRARAGAAGAVEAAERAAAAAQEAACEGMSCGRSVRSERQLHL